MNLTDYFYGNPDTYVTQRADGGYHRVSEKYNEKVIQNHLAGKITASFYPLLDKETKVIVFDADDPIESEFNTVGQRTIELCKILTSERVKYIVEWSGRRGYHIWVFFDGLVNAKEAFSWAQSVVAKVNSFIFGPIEIMPTTGGLGHAIKLPLGIHRKTGKRSRFVIASTLEQFVPESHPKWLDIQLALLKSTGFNEASKLSELSYNKLSFDTSRFKSIPTSIDLGIWAAYHDNFELSSRYCRMSCKCGAHIRGDKDPSLVVYFDAPGKAHCFKTGVNWDVESYFRNFIIDNEKELQGILKKYGYKSGGDVDENPYTSPTTGDTE